MIGTKSPPQNQQSKNIVLDIEQKVISFVKKMHKGGTTTEVSQKGGGGGFGNQELNCRGEKGGWVIICAGG